MSYNLMKYGVTETGCTNPVSTKNTYLKTIIDYFTPDILGVCEMAPSATYVNNLKVNVLNTSGRTYFTSAALSPNTAGSNVVNMLYFNSDKLGLASQTVANTFLRDIDVYKLYYKSATLGVGSDTVFLYVIMAHLKAGSSTSDESDRQLMATNVMSYVNSNLSGKNVILMGDLNVYSSSEDCYQTLTNYSNPFVRFIDPINTPGGWSGNSTFKNVHTQSTRSSTLSDCGSSGGMDDRFDQILASRGVMGDSDRVRILPSTYRAIGQDGNHFNLSVNASPTNTDVPSAVASALYVVSDHLPVTASLVFTDLSTSIEDKVLSGIQLYPNPASTELMLWLPGNGSASVTVTDISGHELQKNVITQGESQVNVYGLPSGLYLVSIQLDSGRSRTLKLMKN